MHQEPEAGVHGVGRTDTPEAPGDQPNEPAPPRTLIY